MAIEAALQSCDKATGTTQGIRLRDIEIPQALFIPDTPTGIEVVLELRPSSNKVANAGGWKEFSIHSVTNDGLWTEVCHGLVTVVSTRQNWTTEHMVQPQDPAAYRVRIFPEDVYKNLRSLGIFHGPFFQNLQYIRARDSQSVAIITIPDTPSVMPYGHFQKHVVHPGTLDTIIQSAYAALPESKEGGLQQALVPISMKSISIDFEICNIPGHKLYSYAAVSHRGASRAQFSLTVTDGVTTSPTIQIDGLVMQSLGNISTKSNERSHKDEKLTYAVWVPDMTFKPYDHMKNELTHVIPDGEAEIMLDLRRVCLYFIRKALNSITDDEASGLERHFQRYYQWMKTQDDLARDNKLAPDSSTWLGDDWKALRRLVAKVKTTSVNGEMVCRLGPSIASIMRRHKTTEQLMQADSLLSRYNADAVKLDRCRDTLASLVRHLVHKFPRARILDIGVGPRNSVHQILSMIGFDDPICGPLVASYDVAVSGKNSDLFGSFHNQSSPWKSLIRYKRVDLDLDFVEQDFEESIYDLVVVSHSLHELEDLSPVLRSIRRLLKPRGMLLLLENTQEQIDISMVSAMSTLR